MSSDELPIGDTVDFNPARPLERAALDGAYARLEPIDPAAHAGDLYAASHGEDGQPAIWTYLAYGPFESLDEFHDWLTECQASHDPLFLAVLDRVTGRPGGTGRAGGMASYLRMEPEAGAIEIGNIWFAPVLQRTRQATEAIFLMMRHAFDGLGYRRLEWKCNHLNAASRRAADRFGFTFEGIFRQHMIVKGRNRDTAWYAMMDHEWPRVRAGFEAWLAPGNFDEDGQERTKLAVQSGG
ncbi:MAG: GNAT family protein [Alphaproteobacteria bacterium]|jgi:RimJ/RimL family protein N-acetyltransferase|nr:GNAT family protein [Alphaproteobacteria bacterium]